MINLYGYQKCSTCKKAMKKLNELQIEYSFFDFIENNLDLATIERIYTKSNADIDKLFNTRGKKYRDLNLKEKLSKMTVLEKLKLLSNDGYLIKRPILESDDTIIIGYSVNSYEKLGE